MSKINSEDITCRRHEGREEEETVTSSPSDSPEEHMLMPVKGQRCSCSFKRPLYSQEQEIEPKDIRLEGGGQVWWMEFKWVMGCKLSSCQGGLRGWPLVRGGRVAGRSAHQQREPSHQTSCQKHLSFFQKFFMFGERF